LAVVRVKVDVPVDVVTKNPHVVVPANGAHCVVRAGTVPENVVFDNGTVGVAGVEVLSLLQAPTVSAHASQRSTEVVVTVLM
jgi:hypothetical protein